MLRQVKRLCILILCLSFWRNAPAQIATMNDADTRLASFRQTSGTIRISANLVTVPVSVLNTAGLSITDLNMNDFRIKEDGRTEEISTLIETGQSSLHLVLIVDLSGSVHSNFEFERSSAVRFLGKVWKPGDSVSVISIGKQPEVHLTASGSRDEALHALASLQPTESPTAFFDAVTTVAALINRPADSKARQAAIVFSDGEDNRSDRSFREAVDAVRRSGTVVYSINPGGASVRLNEISRKGQEGLVALTGRTGGAAFVSDPESDLDPVFDTIATELRAQYLLGYYSSDTRADGSFRSISVSVPQKPEMRVRARRGYYAVQ